MARKDQLRVNEIFHSIQGEGTRAGRRCVFIRLTGCHLRCTYCDTEYAFFEGEWMTLEQILERVRSYACPFVEVTGGEPLLQPAVYSLLERLLAEFETVALETSGAVSIEGVDPRVVRIVDVKTPSSGESDRNHWPNLDLLTPNDEAKFVIGTREDYEWSRAIVARYGLTRRCPVLFSPVINPEGLRDLLLARGRLDPQQLAEWILEDHLNVRLNVQVHKFIWSPETRGV
jgi:7-carboxy-7-deazaguanine synthase